MNVVNPLPPVLDGLTFATVAETATVLRCDPGTVRRGVAAGDIPATKVGRSYRIPVRWIKAQLAKADRA